MKWMILIVTVLFDLCFVRFVPFMHSTIAIIFFLAASLFIGFVMQESREDMPPRPKDIVTGFMYGTYASFIIISALLYWKVILVN